MTGKTILDLKRNQCRYPTGENEKGVHIFCAKPAEYDGCPYCATHAAECFDRRPEERKRADRERAAHAALFRKAQNNNRLGPHVANGRKLDVYEASGSGQDS